LFFHPPSRIAGSEIFQQIAFVNNDFFAILPPVPHM